MSTMDPASGIVASSEQTLPVTLPISVTQYSELVRGGHFDGQSGQIELINGRIVRMNPQGPQHASPIDILGEWSVEQSRRRFWIRIEKPIELPMCSSSPEPDIAWVKRQSYADRHPQPNDISLLIEASVHSVAFDTGEKCELYAAAAIAEYWQINVLRREIRVHRDLDGNVFRTITTHAGSDAISPLCLPSASLQVASLFESEP